MLIHRKSDHTYWNSSSSEFLLMSVTQALKSKQISSQQGYWSFWALYKVLEERITNFKQIKPTAIPSLKWLETQANNFDITEIEQTVLAKIKEWKDTGENAAEEGTEKHAIEEQDALAGKYYSNPFTAKSVTVFQNFIIKNDGDKIALSESLIDQPDGLYLEEMLSFKIWAGTSDQIFKETIGKNIYIDICDFKFKKKFNKSNRYQKFLFPWNDLEESDLNKAALQLSFYAYMLEQQGFTPRYLGVKYRRKTVPVTYLRDHIIKYIEDYFNPIQEMPLQDLSEVDHLL